MDEKYEIVPTKSFGELAKDFKPQEKLTARNSWEDLINQIALHTNEKDKMKLASLLAIKGHMLKLSTTDLHYLLNKKKDPAIRSYTGFIKWSFGLCRKK